MAKYSTLFFLTLTLLNFANAQVDELPLAFSETYEYLQQNGEQLKKTTLTDLTGDKPLEIIIWSTETNINRLKRTLNVGIIDGDTLREITIQRFDDSGNLILEIDSTDSQLKSRREFEYKNRKLQRTKKSDESSISNTTFFYEDDKLIKELKSEQAGLFSTGETLYTTIYHYNDLDQISTEFYLSSTDTLSVTKHSYDQAGNRIKSISDDSIQTWKYDQAGLLVEEYNQVANLTLRNIYSYNSSEQLVKKLTYRKQ